MNAEGPIIIIEDDIDDHDILKDIFKKLDYPNEILFFHDGEGALNFLNEGDVVPFLILSDINLPKLDGFELREKIRTDAQLDIKCIPYLFFTTSSNEKHVIDAYSKSAQGFFIKPNNIIELENTMTVIMEYWRRCLAPKNVQSLKNSSSNN